MNPLARFAPAPIPMPKPGASAGPAIPMPKPGMRPQQNGALGRPGITQYPGYTGAIRQFLNGKPY